MALKRRVPDRQGTQRRPRPRLPPGRRRPPQAAPVARPHETARGRPHPPTQELARAPGDGRSCPIRRPGCTMRKPKPGASTDRDRPALWRVLRGRRASEHVSAGSLSVGSHRIPPVPAREPADPPILALLRCPHGRLLRRGADHRRRARRDSRVPTLGAAEEARSVRLRIHRREVARLDPTALPELQPLHVEVRVERKAAEPRSAVESFEWLTLALAVADARRLLI